MKLIVMLSLGTLLSVFAWIVAMEQIRPQNITATVQPESNKNCNHTAIIRAYRSLNYGTICAYILEVDNGDYINPVDLPKNFHLQEGQRITVDYEIIGEGGYIGDCVVTVSPVMAARILCIAKLNGKK